MKKLVFLTLFLFVLSGVAGAQQPFPFWGGKKPPLGKKSGQQTTALLAKCTDRNTDVSILVDISKGAADFRLMGNPLFGLQAKYLPIRGSDPKNLIELKGNSMGTMHLNKSRKLLYFREGNKGTFCNVSLSTVSTSVRASGKPPTSTAARGAAGRSGSTPPEASGATTQGRKSTTSKKSATYRVIVNGFRVNRETWDHMLNVDGCKDEVFVQAKVTVMDKNGRVVKSYKKKTKVMGDINNQPGRVRAGRGSDILGCPGGNKGGLATGNQYPGKSPWKRSTTPKNDRVPFMVWEGELAKGGNTVMIIPTIWEYDGGTDLINDFLSWTEDVERDTKRLIKEWEKSVKQISDVIGGNIIFSASDFWPDPPVDISAKKLHDMIEGVIGKAADRPIGMKRKGGDYVFDPVLISLNYDKAEALVKREEKVSLPFMPGRVFSLGKGVFPIIYKDAEKLKGSYTLYIQVEKVR